MQIRDQEIKQADLELEQETKAHRKQSNEQHGSAPGKSNKLDSFFKEAADEHGLDFRLVQPSRCVEVCSGEVLQVRV